MAFKRKKKTRLATQDWWAKGLGSKGLLKNSISCSASATTTSESSHLHVRVCGEYLLKSLSTILFCISKGDSGLLCECTAMGKMGADVFA